MDKLRAWLDEDPAVRARALVLLDGRGPLDPEARAAQAAGVKEGSVARVLDGLALPEDADALYVPKYNAPYHRVIALADMGAPGDEPRLAAALERCLAARAQPDGGFGRRASHLCVTGNLARAAMRLGRGEDPRVRSAVQWLLDHQLPNGAWTCFPDEEPQGTIDAWEALAALAEAPRTAAIERALASGIEFFLEQRLGVDAGYAPWTRLHFPRHYYYDVLVGLELAAAANRMDDPRAAPASALLRGMRDADGRWRIERQHPDIGEGADYVPHHLSVPAPPAPLVVEPEGPSRWATLAAMTVLRRAP